MNSEMFLARTFVCKWIETCGEYMGQSLPQRHHRTASKGSLKRVMRGKVEGVGCPRHIGGPTAVHRDALACILATAPEVRGINKSVTCRTELRHKGIASTWATKGPLKRVLRREVGGIGLSRNIGGSTAVYCDAKAVIVATSPEVRGVKKSVSCRTQFRHKGIAGAWATRDP